MTESSPNSKPHRPDTQEVSVFAGFLSYLVPGMGQIYQGRIGKGILFMVCLYGLFFYGMALGSWRNVYLPDTAEGNNPWKLPELAANIFNRPQFAGQFWIGIVCWPAIVQYNTFDKNNDRGPFFDSFERAPTDERILNDLQRNGDKTWDLAWVYTVIAGVLNVLVIYDAAAGPAFAMMVQEQKAIPEAVGA